MFITAYTDTINNDTNVTKMTSEQVILHARENVTHNALTHAHADYTAPSFLVSDVTSSRYSGKLYVIRETTARVTYPGLLKKS